MKISTFQDLIVWQKSRVLTKEVYCLTNNEYFSKDFGLKGQIQRCAVSIMSNIAEGFSRQTDKERIQFLFIAFGSNAELQSQLFVALDLKYISEEEFNKTFELSTEVAKLISSFIKYLKTSSKSK